ncbi:MAG: hypothetical protein WC959_05805 [Kiritimatiellales bacterium]
MMWSVFFSGAAIGAEWVYLDNGTVRIGVDKARGACIGFFGESSTRRNLLNHYDEGRFIQQSYYGDPDGSDWNGKPWVYNPIQGGNWQGQHSKVTAFEKTAEKIYAKVLPCNWAGGELCPETMMEMTISLTGAVAHIRFEMNYSGETQTRAKHQEMPAVFTDAVLSNLVYTTDRVLTRRVPGWLNERGNAPECWLAWLDHSDWGIGIYAPGTPDFTCYRFSAGAAAPVAASCSYAAPVRTFALINGLNVTYDVFLTIGTLQEIQTQFTEIAEKE